MGEKVFRNSVSSVDVVPVPRLIVFDWKGQIDPWRILDTRNGAGWDTYDDQFAAAGMSPEELREEFNRGKHTSEAYMQQVMQDYIRSSFNDGPRKHIATRRASFVQEEVCDPTKRLYHLKHLLETLQRLMNEQSPKGKIVIMTYNVSGAIFVLNTLIH